MSCILLRLKVAEVTKVRWRYFDCRECYGVTRCALSPDTLSGLQDPIGAILKASYTGGITKFGDLESQLAEMVGKGCAAGRKAVVNALIKAGSADSGEVLDSSLLRVVVDAVIASCE